jgi:hypothetical protein
VGAADCRQHGVDLGTQVRIVSAAILKKSATLVGREIGQCEKDRLGGTDGFAHYEPPAAGAPSARKSQARANVHSFLTVAGDRSRADAVSSMVRPAK